MDEVLAYDYELTSNLQILQRNWRLIAWHVVQTEKAASISKRINHGSIRLHTAEKRMAVHTAKRSRAVPRRSAKSAAHNGKKNRHASRRRRKHRRRNPPVSKNSGPSSATPSRRRYCSQKPSLNGLSFTNRRLPESRLPMQAIWIPIGFISRMPLETCRSIRSRRTLCRTTISGSKKTAAVRMGVKAGYLQRPFRINTCCSRIFSHTPCGSTGCPAIQRLTLQGRRS